MGMFHLLPGQHQSFHCRVYLAMSPKIQRQSFDVPEIQEYLNYLFDLLLE